MSKRQDPNGSNAWLEDTRSKVFAAMWELNGLMTEGDLRGFQVTEIRIKGPALTGGGYKVILKGTNEEGEKSVAFHEAEDLTTLMTTLRARLAQDTLAWKADIPYDVWAAAKAAGEKKK